MTPHFTIVFTVMGIITVAGVHLIAGICRFLDWRERRALGVTRIKSWDEL